MLSLLTLSLQCLLNPIFMLFSSAIDWEFFTVGSDSYLLVSNAKQHVDYSSPLSYFTGTAHAYTGIYQFQ